MYFEVSGEFCSAKVIIFKINIKFFRFTFVLFIHKENELVPLLAILVKADRRVHAWDMGGCRHSLL